MLLNLTLSVIGLEFISLKGFIKKSNVIDYTADIL